MMETQMMLLHKVIYAYICFYRQKRNNPDYKKKNFSRIPKGQREIVNKMKYLFQWANQHGCCYYK